MSWAEKAAATVKNLPNHGRAAAAYWDSMSETQKKYVIAGACSVGLVFFGWSLTKIARKLSAKPEKQPASLTATQAKKHSPTKPLPPANKTAAKNI
jgi:hypothetical protein